ncbi:MAG TPA: lipase family protein [Acidimicrobiales bacterium]|nr:lipase family protein [Acidimicrobiales bacterium]
MASRYRWGLGAALMALLVPLGALVPPAVASGPEPPSQDPFYTYSGPTPLRAVPPGTVLRQRSVQLAFGPGNSTPISAEQLLYRTTDQLGHATATVTTVLTPTPDPVVPRIVGYLSFYDGLGSRCDPSYTLAGGDPGDSTYAQEAEEEELLITWYLSQGDIVTVPDFEGTRLDWMTGHESGYGTLDALRATESYLRIGADTEVGLSGYSGGAVAADWASELAPSYAPKVNIVGVAEGGIPANYLDHFAYINGTAEYSAAIPGELLGLSRAYGVDLKRYMSPFGLEVVQQEANTCIASDFGKYPGLTISSIMLPAYRNLAQVAPFASVLRDQTMGTAKTHPGEPLLMGVGNVDGKGDGAMVAADVKALARHYCAEGVPVDYQEYSGASHTEAGAYFDPETGPFLQGRFAGAPTVSNCSSLGS